MANGRLNMKKAFTLVELIVVIAIIAILMAAIGTSVRKAQLRSRIARAETEANEMTNAIRAYELLVRSSPDGRIINSGSGTSLEYKYWESSCSVSSAGSRFPSATSCAKL